MNSIPIDSSSSLAPYRAILEKNQKELEALKENYTAAFELRQRHQSEIYGLREHGANIELFSNTSDCFVDHKKIVEDFKKRLEVEYGADFTRDTRTVSHPALLEQASQNGLKSGTISILITRGDLLKKKPEASKKAKQQINQDIRIASAVLEQAKNIVNDSCRTPKGSRNSDHQMVCIEKISKMDNLLEQMTSASEGETVNAEEKSSEGLASMKQELQELKRYVQNFEAGQVSASQQQTLPQEHTRRAAAAEMRQASDRLNHAVQNFQSAPHDLAIAHEQFETAQNSNDAGIRSELGNTEQRYLSALQRNENAKEMLSTTISAAQRTLNAYRQAALNADRNNVPRHPGRDHDDSMSTTLSHAINEAKEFIQPVVPVAPSANAKVEGEPNSKNASISSSSNSSSSAPPKRERVVTTEGEGRVDGNPVTIVKKRNNQDHHAAVVRSGRPSF